MLLFFPASRFWTNCCQKFPKGWKLPVAPLFRQHPLPTMKMMMKKAGFSWQWCEFFFGPVYFVSFQTNAYSPIFLQTGCSDSTVWRRRENLVQKAVKKADGWEGFGFQKCALCFFFWRTTSSITTTPTWSTGSNHCCDHIFHSPAKVCGSSFSVTTKHQHSR